MRILTFAPLPWGASPLGWVGVAWCAPFPALLPVGPCVGASSVGGLPSLLGWPLLGLLRVGGLPPLGVGLCAGPRALGALGSKLVHDDDDESRWLALPWLKRLLVVFLRSDFQSCLGNKRCLVLVVALPPTHSALPRSNGLRLVAERLLNRSLVPENLSTEFEPNDNNRTASA